MLKIGTNNQGYPSYRNFSGLVSDAFAFQKTLDTIALPRYLSYRMKLSLPSKVKTFLNTFHFDLGMNSVDVFHFFNTISASRTPWVVTFETAVPRWNTHSKYGMRLLAGECCKKIIALSQNAYDIQNYYLKSFPKYEEAIKAKMMVLHPPQKLCINDYSEKDCDGQNIIMTIIGADFFRKGGLEVLLAVQRLLEEGYRLRLNIVSSMQIGDYASRADADDLNEAQEIIQKFPQHITHHTILTNEKVIDLLRHSHVGLLPSYADTYGYSVLEAQACGCPVITTNIRAMPEINNAEVGWVIDVPKDELGNAIIKNQQDRNNFSELLQEKLYEIMKGICHDPAQIRVKGEKAMKKITTEHNPDHNMAVLEKIYHDAIGGCQAP